MERFGEKLHLLRKKQGLTLKEMALKLGLTTHVFVSNLETGKRKPSVEMVIKIARLLNVSIDRLLLDELNIDQEIK